MQGKQPVPDQNSVPFLQPPKPRTLEGDGDGPDRSYAPSLGPCALARRDIFLIKWDLNVSTRQNCLLLIHFQPIFLFCTEIGSLY